MGRHILVPVDGSQHSHKTLIKACGLAKDMHALLTLIQVSELTDSSGYGFDIYAWHVEVEKVKDEEFVQFEHVLNESGVTWKREFRRGSPAHEIIKFSQNNAVDLIVIGNHGSSSVARFFMGSVCDRVCNNASCDVYVVK